MSKKMIKKDSVYNEIDLAWAAGIIDGEGSILLTKLHKNENRNAAISVDNTDITIINTLTKLFGGSIITKKKYKKHHLQCYTWKLSYNKAFNLMQLLLPYMRHNKKCKRIKVLIHYKKLIKRNGKYTISQKQRLCDTISKFYSLS